MFPHTFGKDSISAPARRFMSASTRGLLISTRTKGWQTILFTTPSERPLRNPGLGLVGYAWEESGPSLAARAGRETLAQHVDKMSVCHLWMCSTSAAIGETFSRDPGGSILIQYCDWPSMRRSERDFESRFEFSCPTFISAQKVALPEFLRDRIPLVKIGRIPGE